MMSLESYISKIDYDGIHVSKIEFHWGLQNRPLWKQLSSLSPSMAVMWAGRFSADESLAAEWALAMAFEKAFNMTPSTRSIYLRGVLSELQRVQWCFRYQARIFKVIKDRTRSEKALAASEKVVGLLETLTGARVLHQFIQIGGMRSDFSIGDVERIERTLCLLEEFDEKIFSALYHDLVLIERLQSEFIVDEEFFEEIGATGPIAQASGLAWDIRKLKSYPPYDDIPVETFKVDPFELKRRAVGRHWDRLLSVRFQSRQSIEMIRKLLKNLPQGSVGAVHKTPSEAPEGDFSSVVEAPTGALHCVISGGEVCFSSISMRMSSHLERLLTGVECEDLSLAFQSLAFDFAQGDLV